MQNDLKKILQLCYAEGGTPEMLPFLLDHANVKEEFYKLIRDYFAIIELMPYIWDDTQGFMMAYVNNTPLDIYTYTNRRCYANRIARELSMRLWYIDVRVWYYKKQFVIAKKNSLCPQACHGDVLIELCDGTPARLVQESLF
jgi:hypothetical protein